MVSLVYTLSNDNTCGRFGGVCLIRFMNLSYKLQRMLLQTETKGFLLPTLFTFLTYWTINQAKIGIILEVKAGLSVSSQPRAELRDTGISIPD